MRPLSFMRALQRRTRPVILTSVNMDALSVIHRLPPPLLHCTPHPATPFCKDNLGSGIIGEMQARQTNSRRRMRKFAQEEQHRWCNPKRVCLVKAATCSYHTVEEGKIKQHGRGASASSHSLRFRINPRTPLPIPPRASVNTRRILTTVKHSTSSFSSSSSASSWIWIITFPPI